MTRPVSIMPPKAIIKFVPKEGFYLFVNGKRDDFFFSHEERVGCLKKANEKFDNELQDPAEKFKDKEKGAYLWCYTAEFLRSENITDLIRVRFVQELIYLAKTKEPDLVFELHTYWPIAFVNELKKNGVSLKINFLVYCRFFIRERIKWAYHSLNALKKNFLYILKAPNPPFKGMLVDANKNPKKNRLDDLKNLDQIPLEKKYFSGQEHKMEGFPEGTTVVFRREINVILFFKGLLKTLEVGFFLIQAKRHISNGLAAYLSGLFDLRLFDLILYGLVIEKYFRKSEIQHIVHVSTMTKPTYRQLMKNAKKHGIPFTLVSSRSLKVLSSSERLLPCDVEGYSGTKLPDHFIMRDAFSTRVFDDYPGLKKNILLGGRFVELRAETAKQKKGIGLLIMFTHVEDVCKKILEEVGKLRLENFEIQKVFFRSHPAVPITQDRIAKISGNIDILDISGKDYSAIKDYDTIAVSGPTTGALEAVMAGAMVLWLPYVWGDGILLDEFMNAIGEKCRNPEELKTKFQKLVNNTGYLKDKIEQNTEIAAKEFSSPALISECLEKIIKQQFIQG